MEIRMLVAAMVMHFESWTGAPEKPGQWEADMKPYDFMIMHPTAKKCVIKLKFRN
jgi:hypothetical protein